VSSAKKKVVNFVLLLLFGSAKPKSSLFLARGGASRAPTPSLPVGQNSFTRNIGQARKSKCPMHFASFGPAFLRRAILSSSTPHVGDIDLSD